MSSPHLKSPVSSHWRGQYPNYHVLALRLKSSRGDGTVTTSRKKGNGKGPI